MVVRRELLGHLGQVYTVRLFPSGLVVLTGGADMQVKIWSVQGGRYRYRHHRPGQECDLCFEGRVGQAVELWVC